MQLVLISLIMNIPRVGLRLKVSLLILTASIVPFAIISTLKIQMVLAAAGSIVFLLLLGGLLTRNVLRQIKRLTEATNRLEKGDMEVQVDVNAVDELGDLAHAFNRMVRSMHRRSISIRMLSAQVNKRKKAEDEVRAAYEKLKETQFQLIQAEKLKVVGTLASGVAHEVKNPLAIIMQGMNYLEEEIGPDKENMSPQLDMIKKAVIRADKIIHGMLDFSRPAPLELKPSRINKVIRASLVLVGKQLKLEDIKVTKNFAHQLPSVMIDENQMQQVFINIILNAVQAMPKGGSITIKTYAKELMEAGYFTGKRKTDLFKAGDTVVICELEDTGTGIPKNKLDRVFDPFFTTKPPGKGTGLGLAIIKTIIERHKGVVQIESEEQKGTKIIITLPAVH